MYSRFGSHSNQSIRTVNIMANTARLQAHQYETLCLVFCSNELPLGDIATRLHELLPYKYSPLNVHARPLTKKALKSELLRAGSYLYEKFIDELRREPRDSTDTPAYPELAAKLSGHSVPQVYRYLWIWTEDQSVVSQGCSWFTSREACLAKGMSVRPRLETFDGPRAPRAVLCLEAVTPCNVFKADRTLKKLDRKKK